MKRYKSSDRHYRQLICLDCSSRTTVVAIPVDEMEAHDSWHQDTESDGPGQWAPDLSEHPAYSRKG